MANTKQGKLENKEQVVAQLYALRAGLSAISMEKDEAVAKEEYKDELDKKVEKLKTDVDQLSNDCINNENKLKEMQELKDKYKGQYVKPKRTFKELWNWKEIKKTKEYDHFMSSFRIFGSIAIMIFLGSLIYTIFSSVTTIAGDNGQFKKLCIPLIIIIPIVVILVTIYSLIIFPVSKKRRELDRSEEEDFLNGKTRANKVDIGVLEMQVSNSRQQYEKIDEEFKNEKKLLPARKQEADNQISINVKNAGDINTALEKEYNKLLLPADWENIDLLIFYLQSGRADTIKEALILVDRQSQTDAIINEIRNASTAITREIKSEVRNLGKAMICCFETLSKQIESQHKETMTAINQVNRNLGAINETLSSVSANMEGLKNANTQMVSSVDSLKVALQSKSTITSEELIRDLVYMQQVYGMGSNN